MQTKCWKLGLDMKRMKGRFYHRQDFPEIHLLEPITLGFQINLEYRERINQLANFRIVGSLRLTLLSRQDTPLVLIGLKTLLGMILQIS